jgi:hypothetical protein
VIHVHLIALVLLGRSQTVADLATPAPTTYLLIGGAMVLVAVAAKRRLK